MRPGQAINPFSRLPPTGTRAEKLGEHSGQSHIVGSAAKPPVFEKPPPAYVGRQNFDAPGFDMSGFCGGSVTFWWCFQLCVFDQQGFCSRTYC